MEKDNKKKVNNGLSILKGAIRDGFEGSGIAMADVTVTDASGAVVMSTVTNDNGEFFMTLKGNTSYMIKASKKGYKTGEEKIDLKLGTGDTFSLDKQIMLSKEK